MAANLTEEQKQEMVDWLQAPEQDCPLNKKHPDYIKKDLIFNSSDMTGSILR